MEIEDIKNDIKEIEDLINNKHYSPSINRSLNLLTKIIKDIYSKHILKAKPKEKEKLYSIEKDINSKKSVDDFVAGEIIRLITEAKILDNYKTESTKSLLSKSSHFAINGIRVKCEHKDYKASLPEANFVRSYVELIIQALGYIIEIEIDDELNHYLPTTLINNLPRPDYLEFIGRKEKIEEIITLLSPEERAFIISIDGIGGVGKSALALNVSNLCLESELYSAIIWVSAKKEKLGILGVEAITPNIKSLDDLLDIILIENGNIDAAKNYSLEKKEEAVNELLVNCKTLLAIDNFETISDISVERFLKKVPVPSKVLVTSRKRMGEVEKVVLLEEFTVDETIQFLRSELFAKNIELPMKEDFFSKMHELTGGVPLALKMVIAWIIENGLSIENIQKKLQGHGSDILTFCFEENYEKHMDHDTKRIFCVFPIFDSEPTYEQLKATTKLNEERLNKGLTKLLNLSLIFEIRKEESSYLDAQYGMLPLTMMFAHQKLTENRGLDQESKKALSEYLELNQQTQEAAKQLDAALLDVGGQTPKGRMAAQLANLGLANFQRGNYNEAVRLCEQAIRTDSRLSYSYQIYATIERVRGNYTKSDALYKTASELNPKNPVIWSSWGMLKSDIGDLVNAQAMLERSLVIKPNSPDVRQRLTVIKSKLGYFKESIDLAKRNMIFPPRNREERRINTMTMASCMESYWKFGFGYQKTDTKRALEIYSDGLDYYMTNEMHCFQNNRKILYQKKKFLRGLGIVNRILKNYEKAEEFLKEALFDVHHISKKNKRSNLYVDFDRVLNLNAWGKIKEMNKFAAKCIVKYGDIRFADYIGDEKLEL